MIIISNGNIYNVQAADTEASFFPSSWTVQRQNDDASKMIIPKEGVYQVIKLRISLASSITGPLGEDDNIKGNYSNYGVVLFVLFWYSKKLIYDSAIYLCPQWILKTCIVHKGDGKMMERCCNIVLVF